MLKKVIILAICNLLLQHIKAPAQRRNIPVIALPPTVTKQIPPGYSILDTVMGDLNLDAFTDMAVVLKNDSEENDTIYIEIKRPLLLFTGSGDKTYTLAGSNNQAVCCKHCGGMTDDPYSGIKIKNGYFSVEHFGGTARWKWSHITTFKYNPKDKDWYLYKDNTNSMDMSHLGEKSFKEKPVKRKTVKDFGKVRFNKYMYED